MSPLVEDEAAGEDMSNILVYNRSVVAVMTVFRRYKYKYWLTMDPMRRKLVFLSSIK